MYCICQHGSCVLGVAHTPYQSSSSNDPSLKLDERMNIATPLDYKALVLETSNALNGTSLPLLDFQEQVLSLDTECFVVQYISPYAESEAKPSFHRFIDKKNGILFSGRLPGRHVRIQDTNSALPMNDNTYVRWP